jgi:signal transduction histidine kinase
MDPSIGDLGLLDSVNDLIESIHLTKKINIVLNADAELDELLADSQKLMIFRILQEALNNIIKYAKATTVYISIRKKENDIDLKIVDDGVGFELDTNKKGIGLKNIQNRVYLANGKLLVDTAPGKGCKIMINFPIKNEAK